MTLSNDISYGSDLTSLIPEIEGYKWTSTKTVESTEKNGWLSSGDSTIYTTLTVPVTEDNAGVVNISGTYTAKKYLFKPDSETISHWTITYTDGAESSSVTTINSSDAGNELEVKYHSVITFTTVDSTPAEYVTLKHYQNEKTTLTSKDKVADYTDYTFSMPAEAMIATEYITVETLYLDDGTISITESGYTMVKNDSTVVNITWPGDYIILQCEDNNSDNHETANTLSLEGDLSSREINIGTLNITSADSITLVNGTSTDSTKVNLKFNYNGEESTITAKNILVPQYSELTALTGLSDTSKIATINLEPATNTAAIGAATSSPINGKIDLSYLDISTKMEAPSVASGIGAGNQNQTLAAGSVAISNCTFTMDERLEMVRECIRDYDNVSVVIGNGLTVDFARKIGATVLVRGIRAVSDYEYELQLATANMTLAEDIHTIFILAKPEYSFLSSSTAKVIAKNHGDLTAFVPDNVAKKLKEKYQ